MSATWLGVIQPRSNLEAFALTLIHTDDRPDTEGPGWGRESL